jgi:hypothetical protein
MSHFWGSVHVGVRFKAQVHHYGDGPGLLGAAILCLPESGYSGAVSRGVRPSRFELPKAARITLWTMAILFGVFLLMVVGSLIFLPGLYR